MHQSILSLSLSVPNPNFAPLPYANSRGDTPGLECHPCCWLGKGRVLDRCKPVEVPATLICDFTALEDATNVSSDTDLRGFACRHIQCVRD